MKTARNLLAVTFAACLVQSTACDCRADGKGILEFEGRQTIGKETHHYSYVFLKNVGVVIQLNYDRAGRVDGQGYGQYQAEKSGRLTINWAAGGKEVGRIVDAHSYRITSHTDTRQVGTLMKGRWQHLTDPTRMQVVDRYVTNTVGPALRRQASIRRQLQELQALQFKTSMDIANMWLETLD